MKYLIAGTGGVGGSIAGFLSLAGKDVTCIARGAHLQAIQKDGLKLKSDLKGEHTLVIPTMNAEEFNGKADVIFVCVKGYSVDSITELIKRASHEKTVVIPILNVYGTGPRIQRLVPGVTVLNGCIYIVGFVSGTGEITQMGKSSVWCMAPTKGHRWLRALWKPFRKTFRKVESKQRFLRTSIGIHSSNGRSSRQWPSPVLTMTCRWVKFRSRGKYVIRSSAFLPRVPHWGVSWESNFPKTLSATI